MWFAKIIVNVFYTVLVILLSFVLVSTHNTSKYRIKYFVRFEIVPIPFNHINSCKHNTLHHISGNLHLKSPYSSSLAVTIIIEIAGSQNCFRITNERKSQQKQLRRTRKRGTWVLFLSAVHSNDKYFHKSNLKFTYRKMPEWSRTTW